MSITTVISLLAALVMSATTVFAQVSPTSPGPGNVYNQGSRVSIEWGLDSTKIWTNMSIDLMTGSNFDMVSLNHISLRWETS